MEDVGGSANLGLELHDLEPLGQLIELLVDVHQTHRRVRHHPVLSVHSLHAHAHTHTHTHTHTHLVFV